MEFCWRTKGNAKPGNRPRVYFTCHPEDQEQALERICQDLFRHHDCAVYYTQDMTQPILEEDMATDLGRMNLFVVPVSMKLLTQPNRAMDRDIVFAQKSQIPVLPIMLEPGLESLYMLPEKFGNRQYLDPIAQDPTAVSYEEKLKKYLDAVLVSRETARRIRSAFDGYIFLSYRKKDRRQANALMRLIHAEPEYRDIAIWYDEYLTPGESFYDNIQKAMEESGLFALVVTPNLLEPQNFVMTREYPAARQAGMAIFPVQMCSTDRAELELKYPGIPPCVDPNCKEAFAQHLQRSLAGIANAANNTDGEHLFLMGLAYLDGIDVETDRERGLDMISRAADLEYPEAMYQLLCMYREGAGVPRDLQQAARWAEKLAAYWERVNGEMDPNTLTAINNLSVLYSDLGRYEEALILQETAYTRQCRVLGEDHAETLQSLGNLAVSYSLAGHHGKALDLQQQAVTKLQQVLGENHPATLNAMNNLAVTYVDVGELSKAMQLQQRVYERSCSRLGEENHNTLISLSSIGKVLDKMGKAAEAQQVHQKVYDCLCRVLGPEHPHTLDALDALAGNYSRLGDYQKALELTQQAVTVRRQVLGDAHPRTLVSINNLALLYADMGQYQTALDLEENVYDLHCQLLGKLHPDTVSALSNLAVMYSNTGNYQKALELQQQAYESMCQIQGEKHPRTIEFLMNLAVSYYNLNNIPEATRLQEKGYELSCQVYGQTHPNSLTALNNLLSMYGNTGDPDRLVALKEMLYQIYCQKMGQEHPDTLTVMGNLAVAYDQQGRLKEAMDLKKQLYTLQCRVLGEEHPETLINLGSIATGYFRMGDKLQAQEILERIYPVLCRVLGKFDPTTMGILAFLQIVRKLNG